MIYFYGNDNGREKNAVSFYRKIIAKSDRLNDIILIFATSYQNQ